MKNNKLNAQKSLTVLQVLPSLISGGVERGTVDIANAAARKGIVMLVASAGGQMTQLFDKKVRHITLPLNAKNPLIMAGNALKLRRIAQKYDVDIIHARSRAPAWSAFLASKCCNIPFLTTFHGTYGHRTFFKRLYNSVMVRGDAIIAISAMIKEHIKAVYHTPESNIHLIHRGVDLSQFNPAVIDKENIKSIYKEYNIDASNKIIFCPGRITRWKGQDQLVKALALLPAAQNYQCIIAGKADKKGAFERELKQMITKNNLSDKVLFIPEIPANIIPAFYALSSFVVCASQRPEAFGRIPIEAAAMGKWVIATDIGGFKETIVNGKTGCLVSTNSIEELSQAIEKALNNPQDKQALFAQEYVKQHFSLELMQEKTLALYSALGQKRA